jgi:deoxyhypusine synthase
MLVPNSNYCAFEDWIMPILNAMHAEQEQHGTNWTPSKVSAGSRTGPPLLNKRLGRVPV